MLELQLFTETASPSLTLDNVSAMQNSALSVTGVVCGDPNAPLSVPTPTPTEAPAAGVGRERRPASRADRWLGA